MNLILHFTPTKNDKFKRPIAYTDKGILAVIEGKSENAQKVKAGEDWDCELIEDKQTFVIVKPLKIVRNKEENIDLLKARLLELKNKWEGK